MHSRPLGWVPPKVGCFKLNVDAVISSLSGFVGICCVIRNQVGKVMGVIDDRKHRLMLFVCC